MRMGVERLAKELISFGEILRYSAQVTERVGNSSWTSLFAKAITVTVERWDWDTQGWIPIVGSPFIAEDSEAGEKVPDRCTKDFSTDRDRRGETTATPISPEDPWVNCGEGEGQTPFTRITYETSSNRIGTKATAEPLTRCVENVVGSQPGASVVAGATNDSDPNWPFGWGCVPQTEKNSKWVRMHLIHGGARNGIDLHGPGNDARNLIIAPSDLNRPGMPTGIYGGVEAPAIDLVYNQQGKTLWYETTVTERYSDDLHTYAYSFARKIAVEGGELVDGQRQSATLHWEGSTTQPLPTECERRIL